MLAKSDKQIEEKEKALQAKSAAFEAMKMESDATIQELRDQYTQASQMNERLFQAREILEKERDELRISLQNKMLESNRLEESLRE